MNYLKKTFAIFLQIFLAGTSLLAQTGDGRIDPTAALNELNKVPYANISVDRASGMLSFSNDQAASSTINILESANKIYQAEIISSIRNLSEDQVDGLRINDALIFETFESKMTGFRSLRSIASEAEEKFFQQEEVEGKTNPADEYDYAGPSFFRCVLNAMGEFKVGRAYAKIMPDGGNYLVTNGDLKLLEFLRTDPELSEITKRRNITVVDQPVSSRMMGFSCHANRKKTDTKYKTVSGKKYRAELELQVYNFSFLFWSWHNCHSELKSRKKGGLFNWFWVKHYTAISINMSGNVYKSIVVPAVCEEWEYDPNTGQWVFVGVYDCSYTVDCEGDKVAVNSSASVNNHELKVQNNYNYRVSASDKDGTPGILKSTYNWMGDTYNLAIYP